MATLGKSSIRVAKLPRVALFTTGDEVKPIDSELSPVEIRNSNQWLIKSLLKTWLIKPQKIQHIADEMSALKETIATAINFDIIIMCGGVSAGDADFVPDALTALGVQKLFHKVAIKPGKPVWCGLLPHGGIVFALPGNPFSCLVNFKLLIEPYLRSSFGLEPLNTRILPFEGQRKRKSNLDEFFPAKIKGFPSRLTPTEINGSGDIRLGIGAEALACHSKKHPELESGMLVEYYPLH
nr:molybdopterin-binding protein [Pedobacter sp. SYSU D00535]